MIEYFEKERGWSFNLGLDDKYIIFLKSLLFQNYKKEPYCS